MKRAYQITAVVITVLILGGMLIQLLPSKATGKTIEQAIEKSGRQVEKVIHKELRVEKQFSFIRVLMQERIPQWPLDIQIRHYGAGSGLMVGGIRIRDVETPGDISGVVYITMDDAGAWKMALAKEMTTAGLPVDMNKFCS